MSACAKAPDPALVRVSSLLKLLANRTRSGAETIEILRLQAQAEVLLQALCAALGELDERPLRSALEDMRFTS